MAKEIWHVHSKNFDTDSSHCHWFCNVLYFRIWQKLFSKNISFSKLWTEVINHKFFFLMYFLGKFSCIHFKHKYTKYTITIKYYTLESSYKYPKKLLKTFAHFVTNIKHERLKWYELALLRWVKDVNYNKNVWHQRTRNPLIQYKTY